jgi:hypothetical protein
MCLIVYSPAGTLFDYEIFDCAQAVNSDGIGIMSAWGVERFLGPTASNKAWCHLKDLQDGGVPYGIHFRMATHGDVSLGNCHPFSAPRSDALIMHNGIIRSTAGLATSDRSDTALFVQKFMRSAPGPERPHHGSYFRRISRLIGLSNTLLVLHSDTGEFTICNEDVGVWMGDHWYSNSECFPWHVTFGASVGMEDTDWFPDEFSTQTTCGWPELQGEWELDAGECPGWRIQDSLVDSMDD